jgi:hypothetical protein
MRALNHHSGHHSEQSMKLQRREEQSLELLTDLNRV